MKTVIQRVIKASVHVENELISEIGRGFLILFGIHKDDEIEDIKYITHKVINLRIFEDQNHKANLALNEIKGKILLVPQFTLISSTRKGNRPSFSNAADIKKGKEFSDLFYSMMREAYSDTLYGVFQAYMRVELINDGPFTIIIDSLDRHKPRRS